ncbi:hypothetical protein B0H10DRAFT_1943372 [Mycena sp. CBHHK59/15]|nr:hypothetical protein B0H10DRAFT_1943372 [Mycena sp. CBHHK59/15]
MKSRVRAIIAAALAVLTVAAASPPVKVTLRSSWNAPPILMEIIETVALENPDAFFPFLDRVTDPFIPSSQEMSNESIHSFAFEVAATHGFVSDPGSMATPKIGAFSYHYATHIESVDCGSWVDSCGEAVCDVEKLYHLAGIKTIDPTNTSSVDSKSFTIPKILTFDHIYPSPAQTLERPPRTAIFYASLASSNFRELH